MSEGTVVNSKEAAAKMDEHFTDHACTTDTCDVASTHYKDYLVALAEKYGHHPQSFPSVRRWMRDHGQEPMPIEEAAAWKPGEEIST
jgi:hypothetical protein